MLNNNRLGKIIATNISEKKGTAKHNVSKVTLDNFGVVGDAHAGTGHRQVSLLSKASIDAFSKKIGKDFHFGDFGENLTFDGLNCNDVGLLDRMQVNDAILEVTQIGKKCHGDGCAIYRDIGKCIMPQEGFFTRVVNPGEIGVGNTTEHTPYIFKILLITLSDRAAHGVYEDQSGFAAKEMVSKFFSNSHWHWQIEQAVLPDDGEKLGCYLQGALNNKVDLIFTLGSTGVGERDIAPEAVNKICDKFLHRVMDNICLKFGASNPKALLSRSVAGIVKKTQIYTLPGSVGAATEYLTEILKIVGHVTFMLHNIDDHN